MEVGTVDNVVDGKVVVVGIAAVDIVDAVADTNWAVVDTD